MLDTNYPLHSVVLQVSTNTTYRVIAVNAKEATVIRCTRDNVLYPGALPSKVPMEKFSDWSAHDPSKPRERHPDDF